MTEHIVALFKAESTAAAAERDLAGAGIPTSAMRRYMPTEVASLEPTPPATGVTETSHSSGGGFWAWLWGEDSHTDTTESAYPTDREFYDRGARAGNTVLSLRLDDESLIHTAVTILDGHHPLEINEHAEGTEPTSSAAGSFIQPGTAGNTSVPPAGMDYATPAVAPSGAVAAAPAAPVVLGSESLPAGMPGSGRGDEVISLAEEQLEVGKRTVDRGTTRVRRFVVEKPVEQDVTLHGERVTIERRTPVTGTAAAGGAFEERTIEVRETEEVPVVEKTARVVEEVLIRKEATERTETVRDTLRREEVEVTGNDVPSQSPRP